MPAFKLQHITTGKFASTTLHRYKSLYIGDKPFFPIEKGLSNNGKVYSTRVGVEGFRKQLGNLANQFIIRQLQ